MKTFDLSKNNSRVILGVLIAIIFLFGMQYFSGKSDIYWTIGSLTIFYCFVNSYVDFICLDDNKIIVTTILRIKYVFSYRELFKYQYLNPLEKLDPITYSPSKRIMFLFLKFHFIPLLFWGKAYSKESIDELIEELDKKKHLKGKIDGQFD